MAEDELAPLLLRVRRLHEAKSFAETGGEDPHFRMLLLMEEVGEVCRCLTTGTGDLAGEHADALIVLLGNAVSFGIDLVDAAHKKLDRIERLDPTVVAGRARLISKGSET